MSAFRYAWRSLRRSPWFTLSAIVTFALGIGINVAVFASIDRLLFRPLPYVDADRLFLLQQTDLESGQRITLMPARYVAEARVQLDVIENMATLGDSTGYYDTPTDEGPEIRVSFATSHMLDLCGVRPVLGRGFVEEDDRFERRVALLTHEGWQTRFGGDPGVLGRRLWIRGNTLEIIGVLPPGFIAPGAVIDPDFAAIGLMQTPNIVINASQRTLPPTVRLRRGVSREAAQASVDALVARLKLEMPIETGNPTALELIPIRDAMFGRYYGYLWLVAGGAAFVLFIACANLAGLLLVRGRSRLKDAAVRLSLGASRRRLIGDALAEGFIVCLAAAVASLLVLRWSLGVLEILLPAIFARFSAGVDTRVVIFAFAAAAASSLLAAILPAWLLSRDDVWRVVQGGSGPLGGGSPGRGRWLVAVEAAIGVVLVTGAAVTARNLSGLASADLGFDPAELQLVLIRTTAPTPAERFADMQQALAILRAEPGIMSAAGSPAVSVLRTGVAQFSQDGPPCCRWRITGDYIETIGVPMLAGRTITDEDVRTHAQVALLNETGLGRVWPGVSPAAAIGRTLNLDGEPGREVVGIVGDTRRGHDDDLLPGLYIPVTEDRFTGMLIVARTRPNASPPVYRLRPKIETTGRRSVLYVRPMAPMYSRVLEAPRFRAVLFGTFGAIALLIAMVGLYALTSFDVTIRRHELGVRVALGASRRSVVLLMMTESGRPVVVGLAAGIAIAIWAGGFLQSFLHEFSARDPMTMAAAAAALLAACLLAAWLPAWRASRVDPALVLRTP